MLFDPGAYSDASITSSLTWKVRHPEEVEDWEVDEVIKELEEPAVALEKLKETGDKPMRIDGGAIAITKRLLKVTEELSQIARLCIEEFEEARSTTRA